VYSFEVCELALAVGLSVAVKRFRNALVTTQTHPLVVAAGRSWCAEMRKMRKMRKSAENEESAENVENAEKCGKCGKC
jgi:hypothetical protein